MTELSNHLLDLPEASTLVFKIRSCTVRTDLKNKALSADFRASF